MKNLSSKMLYMLFGSLLSFSISYYFYSENIEIKKIDVYTVINDDYVSKPTFPNSKIELKVDGLEKDKLGLVAVLLINYTTENFIDLPIIIKVTPQKNDDFTLIDYSAKGKGRVNELVTEVKEKYFDGNSYIFSYKANLNRDVRRNA